MQELYLPKARSAGAEALVEVVEAKGDSSKQTGAAICEYAEKANADALVLMRQTKSPVTRIFMGSVTHYCAIHTVTAPHLSSLCPITLEDSASAL
ncbi:hypothetical protein COCOBI_19-1440 [Coccomyxa sp. Obi]|nr:hypothetical protein COCOBI_19-1440 [Coccomyxa sp. Obi]